MPQKITQMDEWLSMIHDRLEGIERALQSAQTSSQDREIPSQANPEEKDLKGLERIECDLCGRKFTTQRGLNTHKAKAHERNV